MIRIKFLDRNKYVAIITNTPAKIIIKLSIRYTSSLILKIIVTTTPTTVRATPASNKVTVDRAVSPIKEKYFDVNVCVKKGSPNTNAHNPVAAKTKTPISATTIKMSGNTITTEKTALTKESKTNKKERTTTAINTPPVRLSPALNKELANDNIINPTIFVIMRKITSWVLKFF